MSYAVVFFRVEYAVGLYNLSVAVGKYLVLRPGRLGHRPGVILGIGAYGYKVRARLFHLLVILSQPGELHGARGSPEASIKDQYNGGSRRVFAQQDELAVAVRQRKIGRLVAHLERRSRDLRRRGGAGDKQY